MLDHKIIYNTKDISRDYGRRDYLEPPERSILEKLKPELPHMAMLDMGVGGGRTTKYFAPYVKEYIGADYASEMLKICRAKYFSDYEFIECDVRYMNKIEYERFDFILFSYNGIDSFNHKQRLIALREINRILKPGGYFAFSSHNLGWNGLPELFRLNNNLTHVHLKSRNPFTVMGSYFKAGYENLKLNLLNKSMSMHNLIEKLRENERGYLYDNSLNGKASIYYITHNEQARQLKETGFSDTIFFSRDGEETKDDKGLENSPWIYYLCKKK